MFSLIKRTTTTTTTASITLATTIKTNVNRRSQSLL
jgi:hypothetical protein